MMHYTTRHQCSAQSYGRSSKDVHYFCAIRSQRLDLGPKQTKASKALLKDLAQKRSMTSAAKIEELYRLVLPAHIY